MPEPSLLPASFTDTTGREWRLRFTGASADDARDLYGADIYDVEAGSFFVKMATDAKAFFGVLWLLIEGQAKAEGLDERAVKEVIDAAAMEAASDAIGEAVVNFTRPLLRGGLLLTIQKVKMLADPITMATKRVIDSPQATATIEKALDKMVDEAIAQIESTPTGSVSN